MPADKIKYQVLDVGQGSGNFIEMYTSDVLTSTVLIDLGSERATDEGGGLSVEYIVSVLNGMTNPTIDYLFLSHSDTDHISLLDQLLDSFAPQTATAPLLKKLLIRKVSYGGDSANYAKGRSRYNVLNRLKTYMPQPFGLPLPLAADYSSYVATTFAPIAPIATVDGVDFYILTANAPTVAPVKRTRSGSTAASGYNKNTVSVIVVASWKGAQYIATGDATGATLATANKKLTTTVKATYFPFVVMVTAPHHGSESTTFSFRASDGSRDKAEPVANFKLFVDNLKSKTITASAGKVAKFRHPSAFLISYFWPWLHSGALYVDPTLTASSGHYYTAYFKPADGYTVNDGTTTAAWPSAERWYTVQTASNIFTNTYYDLTVLPSTSTQTQVIPPNPGSVNAVPTMAPYPPAGVAWTYTAVPEGTSGSNITVQRLDNRANLIALRREIIARSEQMAAIREGLESAAPHQPPPRNPAPTPARPQSVRDLPPPRPAAASTVNAASAWQRRLKVLT
ncbi:MAG: MBL fold metallo-hydrolase [Rhodanobacteraceae bacterium]|nr:MBL fold metallo-hydrolase [Rhodanobacteraceae bacterium]